MTKIEGDERQHEIFQLCSEERTDQRKEAKAKPMAEFILEPDLRARLPEF